MSIKRKDMVEPTTWVSHRLTLFLYYLPIDPSVSKPATHQKLPGRKNLSGSIISKIILKI